MQNIQKILEELYQIDNSLKQNEIELKNILEKMLEIKPNIKIDENFKNQLKNQIENNILKQKITNISTEKSNISKFFIYFLGGVSVGAFSFFMINEAFLNKENILQRNQVINENPKIENQTSNKDTITETQESSSLQENDSITQTEKPKIQENLKIENQILKENIEKPDNSQIKETLKKLSQNKKETTQKVSTTEKTSTENNSNIQEKTALTEASSGFASLSHSPVGKMSSDMMIPYIPQIYTYSFSGNLDNLKIENNLPIYTLKDKNLNENIFQKDQVGIDLSKFENLNISNINFTQNSDYGMNIFVDFDNGNISMWQNYSKWPENNQNEEIKEITDKEALTIADEFIKKYQIDISNYNSPEISNIEQNILYKAEISDTSLKETQKYILYPLNIDGNEIFEDYGEKKGIRITIDSKTKKVSGVSGININKYQKEKTNIETNKENILKSALNGGKSGFIENNFDNQKVKYLNLELTNPTIKYISNYKTENNKTVEYLVPAIFFEVKQTNDPYSPKRVIVPLNKDFYKYDDNGKIVGLK